MKFDKLEVGMTLYDVGTYRMGNTTMRSVGVWTVYVKEIDTENRRALVSWNGNGYQWYGESAIGKLKEKEPILIRAGFGMRRPTREELAEIKAKAKAEALLKAGK